MERNEGFLSSRSSGYKFWNLFRFHFGTLENKFQLHIWSLKIWACNFKINYYHIYFNVGQSCNLRNYFRDLGNKSCSYRALLYVDNLEVLCCLSRPSVMFENEIFISYRIWEIGELEKLKCFYFFIGGEMDGLWPFWVLVLISEGVYDQNSWFLERPWGLGLETWNLLWWSAWVS